MRETQRKRAELLCRDANRPSRSRKFREQILVNLSREINPARNFFMRIFGPLYFCWGKKKKLVRKKAFPILKYHAENSELC